MSVNGKESTFPVGRRQYSDDLTANSSFDATLSALRVKTRTRPSDAPAAMSPFANTVTHHTARDKDCVSFLFLCFKLRNVVGGTATNPKQPGQRASAGILRRSLWITFGRRSMLGFRTVEMRRLFSPLQTRIVRSSPPLTSPPPNESGIGTSEYTKESCPFRILTHSPLCKDQRRMVLNGERGARLGQHSMLLQSGKPVSRATDPSLLPLANKSPPSPPPADLSTFARARTACV